MDALSGFSCVPLKALAKESSLVTEGDEVLAVPVEGRPKFAESSMNSTAQSLCSWS